MNALVFGGDSLCLFEISPTFRFVDTALTWRHPRLLPCRWCACSFLPPMNAEPWETWLTCDDIGVLCVQVEGEAVVVVVVEVTS